MTTVGFLIPIWGGSEAGAVRVALSSVAHQVLQPDQIVVVVDGPSAEALDEELQVWRNRFGERLTLITLPTRSGVALALNEGLARITTDWVARMDADDYSDPHRLSEQMAYVESHPEVDVVGSWLLDYDEDCQRPDRVKMCPERHRAIVSMMWFRNPLNHPSVTFKRTAVETVGGYDADYGDDDHLWAKLWVSGAKYHNIPSCLVRRRRDKQLFKRRGIRWLQSDFRVRKYLRRKGKIGWGQFVFSCTAMFSLRVSPIWLKRFIYLALTRPVRPTDTQIGGTVDSSQATSRTIWIFHHYGDPPDGHWTGTYDVYKHLVSKGHKVTVFTSSFSHYSRRDDRLVGDETSTERFYGGMRFIFVKTTPYKVNDWRRVLNMVSYAWRGGRLASREVEAPDVIVGSTPHPLAAFLAAWVAKRRACPFVLELHDLWLQFLLDTKRLKSWNPIAMVLKRLDSWCYRRAEKIMALWPQMDRYLHNFDVPAQRVAWVPIGVPSEREISDRQPGTDGVLEVVWTGRMGPASNALEILQAAKLLRARDRRDIRFTLIGGGPDEQELRRFAENETLTNVRFTGVLAKQELPRHLRNADVCVAGLPAVSTYTRYGTIPSKLLDYLAYGKPVVFITTIQDNALARAKAGVVVRPESPEDLAAAIERLAESSSEERNLLGNNGHLYIRQFHDPEKIAERISNIVEEVLV